MKIYRVGPLDEGDEFFPSKREAKEAAKFYDLPHGYISEIEIGKLTKAVACKLASGREFAIKQRDIWTADKEN